MDVDFVLLCDAAMIREGLLHIPGAPITRLYRPSVPAPLGVSVAVVFTVERADYGKMKEIEIKVSSPLQDIAKIGGIATVGPRPDKAEPGESRIYMPFVASLSNIATPDWGEHTVSVSLDGGENTKKAKFWVLTPEDQVLPGLSR
jgi:hypothetical protein